MPENQVSRKSETDEEDLNFCEEKLSYHAKAFFHIIISILNIEYCLFQ